MNCAATYYGLVASVMSIPTSQLLTILPMGRGLIQIQCFSRITFFLMLLGIDGVWKIPSLSVGHLLVLVTTIHYMVESKWLEAHSVGSPLCEGQSQIVSWKRRGGVFQNFLPMVCSALAVACSRWLTEMEERRQLCGIVQAQLVRGKVEMAVQALIPPHVLKVQIRAVIALKNEQAHVRKYSTESLGSIDSNSASHSLNTSPADVRPTKRLSTTGSGGDSPRHAHDDAWFSRTDSAQKSWSLNAAARPVDNSLELPKRASSTLRSSSGGQCKIMREVYDVVDDSNRPKPLASTIDMSASFCPEYLPKVVLLMADIQGFTSLSSNLNAKQLFAAINELFTEFDVLCIKWSITKIETVGAYIYDTHTHPYIYTHTHLLSLSLSHTHTRTQLATQLASHSVTMGLLQ